MNQSNLPALLAAILATVVLALPLAHAQTSSAAAAAPGGAASAAASSGGGTSDMMSMMRQNNEKMMGMKPTGDPDVDFAMMMHMHHQGGIQMAEHEIRTGKNADMKKLARKIRDSQKKESAQFERFLSSKGHAVSK